MKNATLLFLRDFGPDLVSEFSHLDPATGSPIYSARWVTPSYAQPVVGQTYRVTSAVSITDWADHEKPSKGLWTRIEFTLEGFGDRVFVMDADYDDIHWMQVGGEGWSVDISLEAALRETDINAAYAA